MGFAEAWQNVSIVASQTMMLLVTKPNKNWFVQASLLVPSCDKCSANKKEEIAKIVSTALVTLHLLL